MKHAAYRIYRFYRDGFASMKLGKKLWLLVAIKLFILFAVVKYFFFPDILKEHFQTDQQRSEYILQQLTQQGE
jgi:hypothetical protein